MTDSSSTPQEPHSEAKVAPLLTGLLEAEYVCPVCKLVVLKVQGNELQYLESHVTLESKDNGQVSFIMQHKLKGGEFVPARSPKQPFLIVKSSIITPA